MSFIDALRDRLFGFNKRPNSPQGPSLQNKPDTPPQTAKTPTPSVAPQNAKVPVKKEGLPGNDMPQRVLFVCSGNICRSAYAAARFKKLTEGVNIKVASAGTLRIVGSKAAPDMIDAARENGLDLEPHRSSALTKILIDSADILFVMEEEHRRRIINISPKAAPRIVMLGMFLDSPQTEIEDPMGKSPDVYRTVAKLLDNAINNWVERNLILSK